MPEPPFRGSGGSAIFVCQSPTPGGRAAVDDALDARSTSESIRKGHKDRCILSKCRLPDIASSNHEGLRKHLRFGSKADKCTAIGHVRFTPKSGHCSTRLQLMV